MPFYQCWYSYIFSTSTVQHNKHVPSSLHLLLHLELIRPNVGSGRSAQLVNRLSLIPHTGAALNHRDNLLGYPVGKLLPATALGGLLVDHVQDPLERNPSALADGEGRGKLQGSATACRAGDVLDSEEGRD